MAPLYKLIYFDIKGLGECIKYILQYKKIEYVCETIIQFTASGPWAEIKSTFPFGQLPVLEVKGKRLYQSQAICLYLAEQHDLKSGDSFEDALLVALGNTFQDFILRVAHYYYTKDPVTKANFKEYLDTKILSFYLERFENNLKQKGDYFGGKLTWVDFYAVAALETINGMMEMDLITGKFPHLEQHMKRIWNLPGIKEYIAKRPPYTR